MSKRGRMIVGSLMVALCGVVLSDAVPLLRGPAPETPLWYWPYRFRPISRWWMSIGAGLSLACWLWWWLRRRPLTPALSQGRGSRLHFHKIGVFGLMVLHLLLQLSFVYADATRTWLPAHEAVYAELLDRTLPPLTSGYFWDAALTEDMSTTLRNFPEAMTRFESEHTRTHPPGLLLLNWLTIRGFDRFPTVTQPIANTTATLRCTDLWLINQPPAVSAALITWALLPMLLATLAIPAAFGLAEALGWSADAQRMAAGLVATLPTLAVFAPKVDQIFAPVTLLLVWAVVKIVSSVSSIHPQSQPSPTANPVIPAQAGIHSSAAESQVSSSLKNPHPSPLPRERGQEVLALLAGLGFGMLVFLSIGNAALALVLGLLFLFGIWKTRRVLPVVLFALGSLLPWLLFWGLYRVAPWAIVLEGLNQHFELVTLERPYGVWTVWNLVDLLMFAGPLVVAGFVVTAWQRRRELTTATIFIYGVLALVIVLDLSGSARGEIGRIWLFIMPLLAVGAAPTLQKYLPSAPCLTLLLTLAIGLTWRTVRPVIVVAYPPDSLSAPTQPLATTHDALLSPAIALTQSQSAGANDSLAITLAWEANGVSFYPYTAFVHVIDEAGMLVAQQDNWPVNGEWPPSCWRGGDRINDTYSIDTSALPVGNYQVFAGMYRADTFERIGEAQLITQFEK